MKKHYVTFYSPGTFLAEQTTKEIDEWNIEKAIKMSKEVKERYGATPYGFYFTTRERNKEDFDSHQSDKSPFYYLGGKVMTVNDLKAEDRDNQILIQNMVTNNWKKVVVTNNSYRWVQPLIDTDIILEMK